MKLTVRPGSRASLRTKRELNGSCERIRLMTLDGQGVFAHVLADDH